MRDIRAGEELFLDYNLDVDESEDRSLFGLLVWRRSCRGTMLAGLERDSESGRATALPAEWLAVQLPPSSLRF